MTECEMPGWYHLIKSMDLSLSRLQEMEDRGVWRAAVHGVAKSGAQLSG